MAAGPSCTAPSAANITVASQVACTDTPTGRAGRGPALPQLVLARLIASGELEQHIRLVRTRQRSRRDALLRALRGYLPEGRVQGVAAGLHLLVTFPGRPGPDTDLAEAILRAGVLVHPLSWHRQRPGVPGILLGYAVHPPDQLHEAARRIAQAVRGTRA